MVLLPGSKIQYMHTGVKLSKTGFRCEPELPISSSPSMSDLTSYGCKVGTDLAEGAGAQSIPTDTLGHQEGWRLQPAHVCADQNCQRHVPVQLLPLYLGQSRRAGSSPAQQDVPNPGSWPGARPGTAPPASHETLPAWQQHAPNRYGLTAATDIRCRAILRPWGNPTVSSFCTADFYLHLLHI